MAISFKFSPKKLNEMFGLGFSTEHLLLLQNFGVTCKANSEGTKLEFGNASHGIVKDMPIKAGVMQMAKEGILPIAAKASVAKKIDAALSITIKQLTKLPIKKASAAVWKDLTQLVAEAAKDDIEAEEKMEGEHFSPVSLKVGTMTPKQFVEGKKGKFAEGGNFGEHFASAIMDEPEAPMNLSKEKMEELAAAAYKDHIVHGAKITDLLPTNKDDALKMAKVKLANATVLYQPVKATTETSTYHCVGIAGKLKFGARWIANSNLSIRVEGPVSKFKDKLVAAGFNEAYIAKGYTSVHFNGIEEIVAKRALGAVLMGTGLEFETPMPDLGVINGEGT